jgi:DnaK suppressor protein
LPGVGKVAGRHLAGPGSEIPISPGASWVERTSGSDRAYGAVARHDVPQNQETVMSRALHIESATADPRLATRLPALRATLEEQLRVATAAVTSILTSRIDPQDEVAVRTRDAALRALAVIDAALDRVDDGRYGICGWCGGPIAIERLNALVTAELCLGCQRRRESHDG